MAPKFQILLMIIMLSLCYSVEARSLLQDEETLLLEKRSYCDSDTNFNSNNKVKTSTSCACLKVLYRIYCIEGNVQCNRIQFIRGEKCDKKEKEEKEVGYIN